MKFMGGKLKIFLEHSRFRVMPEEEHDLAMLVLGGSDV